MRKKLRLISLIVALLFFSCIFALFAHCEELQFVTFEFAPFNFTENGKLVGSSTEVVQKVFSKMRHKPRFESMPWKRSQNVFDNGKAFGIYTYVLSEKRMSTAYLSNPIVTVKDVFFKRKKDNITWQNYSDLTSKKIGASGGYNYWPTFLDAARDGVINVEYVSSSNPDLQNLKKLIVGRTDVFICEISVCNFLQKKHAPEFDSIDNIDKSIGPVRSFHIGFSKKHPLGKQMRDEFNRQFDKMIEAGEVLQIFKKYNMDIDLEKIGTTGALQLHNGAYQ